jgi:hypothetical protein
MNPKYKIRINEITRLESFDTLSDIIVRVEVFVQAYIEENSSISTSRVFVIDFSEEDYNFDNFVSYTNVDSDLIISWIVSKYNVSSFEELPIVKSITEELSEVFSRYENKIIETVNWNVNLDKVTIKEEIGISTGTLGEV